MNESFIIGILSGTLVSLVYDVYKDKMEIKILYIRIIILLIMLLLIFFLPSKCNAWCDNCKHIPFNLQDNIIDLYKKEGEESERLILEIKDLSDKYSFNIDDAFMTSIGAAFASLPNGDIRTIIVSVVLANAAVYFCKTSDCHWKTVSLMNQLEYHLYFFKRLGEELVRNKFMCINCHKIHWNTYYLGPRNLYLIYYPPCIFFEDECECE